MSYLLSWLHTYHAPWPIREERNLIDQLVFASSDLLLPHHPSLKFGRHGPREVIPMPLTVESPQFKYISLVELNWWN